MSVRAYLKNKTDANREIADIGVTVVPGTLYSLLARPARLLVDSVDLPAALQTGEIGMVAMDQVTEYPSDTALAILNGANPEDPLTWGTHVILAQYFRERFTFAEQVAIVAATHTDDEVKNFYDHLHMAKFVDLTKPLTVAGLALLVAKQLLRAERTAAILAY